MGWGDEIICTGQARAAQAKDPNKPVVFIDRFNNIRAHEMWAFNPRITRTWDRRSPAHVFHNGPGLRPYINTKTAHKWTWNDFVCPVGEIYFSQYELDQAPIVPADCVLLEPNVKHKASPNKDWGIDKWQKLSDDLRRAGLQPVQFCSPGLRTLRGATVFNTNTFRLACASLKRVLTAVLPEGGLHHAAAALGVPSVVIYGGFISPRQTGYSLHKNLFTGDEPCGMRVSCKHCKKAMAAITPEEVFTRTMEVIDARVSRVR